MWGIIGGTGFSTFEDMNTLEELNVETPFGKHSDGLARVKFGAIDAIFIPRHGKDQSLLPNEINYLANIYALKKLGVNKIISISTVTSLNENIKPGDMVVADQYINQTAGKRISSFCGKGLVGYVPLANPVTETLTEAVQTIFTSLPYKSHFNKTCICIDGPQHVTMGEARHYRDLGGDIVNMTAFPEYALAHEASMGFVNCCFVIEQEVLEYTSFLTTLSERKKIEDTNNVRAFALVSSLLNRFPQVDLTKVFDEGLANYLLSDISKLSEEHRSWVEIILKQEDN